MKNPMGRGAWQPNSPRGLKESDRTEQLSFPLHINIFKSKLTVIIKFFLNTAFPLGSEAR